MSNTELIHVTGMRKSYKTEAGELEVIKGIDLSINKGEVVAVVGASGAGKSTLLHLLGTIDRPTSGKILYNGKDIFLYNDKELASFRNKTIGFVFQFHHLLADFTALENVMMPGLIGAINNNELVKLASTLLIRFGLKDRLHHRAGELSGGEQQRVALARALVLNPLVVLADEPTGNLDSKTGDGIIDILFEINKTLQTTFVIVTHNANFAKKCHRLIEMVDGQISKE
ncbi:MAG: ABC transporter ATP-binding protein [Candidatus Magnetoovum sp. WYHC-5]|nr:ABC transporter ATP-binding protein [Candidatus Magnetoovum sp. WYHC-5]